MGAGMPVKAIVFDFDGPSTLDTTGSLTTKRFLSERTGIHTIAAAAIGMRTVWFDDRRNDVAGLVQRLATEFSAS